MSELPAWCSSSFLCESRAGLLAGLSSKDQSVSHGFSPAVLADMDTAVMSAWAPSTSTKYHHGVVAFHRFCDTHHIPLEKRLPADEFTLCAFAASHLRRAAGSTVRGHLSAVRAWHIANNVPYAGSGSLRLTYTLKGVENLRPATSIRPLRPPVTRKLLGLLSTELDHSVPLDAAVLACATVAMWGQARLGELLSQSQACFARGTIPCWSDLLPSETPAGSRLLLLPWTKTTGRKGAKIMICRQHGETDPIGALLEHERVNGAAAALPLFSYLGNSGLVCLTKRRMVERCNEIWARHSLPRLTGHAFRVGGTTELLVAGVPPHIVKMMGRWTSEAFLVYWRSLELISPQHAELLPALASSFG
jgi:hypothetical protein